MMKQLLAINASRIVNSILLLIGLVFFKPLAYFVALMMFFAGLTNYCLMEKILQRFGFQNTCSTMAGQAEMQVYDAKTHWEKVYQTKKSNEVSWYQEKPKTSLKLIGEIGLDKNSEIIDVGAGDSKLVDNLLDLGFKNITVLDISPTALNRAKKLLKPNGYLIVSAFSENGPKRCSGLDIKQYSEHSIKKIFSGLEHIKSFEEEHATPWGARQIFICSVLRKGGKK